jgi:hypothetical protein
MKNLDEILSAFAPSELFRDAPPAVVQRRDKPGKMVRGLALVAAVAAALMPANSQGQATTMVRPRQYALLSSQLFTNNEMLNTNAALPTSATGGQTVGVFTNTLIPFGGSHSIGLTMQIINTNKFAANSNLIVTVYPAYDTGGNATGINQAYGTNFSSTPLLTWTISYQTNSFQSTNLPASLWEPATSLGYTITNATASNLVLTLTQSVAP